MLGVVQRCAGKPLGAGHGGRTKYSIGTSRNRTPRNVAAADQNPAVSVTDQSCSAE